MSFADDLREKSNYVNNGQMIQDSIKKTVNSYIIGAVSKSKEVAMKAAEKGLTYISGRYYMEMQCFGCRWREANVFISDGRSHVFDHELIKGDSTREYGTMWERYNFTNEQFRNIGQTICKGISDELRNLEFSNISVTTIEIPWYTENFWGTKKPLAEICDLQFKIYFSWA